MLNTIAKLCDQPAAPFEQYYQDFICKVQDMAIEKEIKAYEQTIIHKPIESQLNEVWKLIR